MVHRGLEDLCEFEASLKTHWVKSEFQASLGCIEETTCVAHAFNPNAQKAEASGFLWG